MLGLDAFAAKHVDALQRQAEALERIASALERGGSNRRRDVDLYRHSDTLINALLRDYRAKGFIDPVNYLTTRGREIAADSLNDILKELL